jgi:hypothetical protein
LESRSELAKLILLERLLKTSLEEHYYTALRDIVKQKWLRSGHFPVVDRLLPLSHVGPYYQTSTNKACCGCSGMMFRYSAKFYQTQRT